MRAHFNPSCNDFRSLLSCGSGKPARSVASKRRPSGSILCTVAGERRSASRNEWSHKQAAPLAVPQAPQASPNGNAQQAVSALAYPCKSSTSWPPAIQSCRRIHGNLTCMSLQVWDAASELASDFWDIDLMVAQNLRRVQNAMRNARLGPHHFAGSTGYGHGDLGRSALDEVLQLRDTHASLGSASLSCTRRHDIALVLH